MNVYGAAESFVPTDVVQIPSSIISYEISPDKKRMALFGFDDILYVADIESGEILFETNAEGLYDMGFSGNDAVIYSIGYNVDISEKLFQM